MLKQKTLFWAPVVLLPVVNIITATARGGTFDPAFAMPLVIGAIAEEMLFRWFLLKKLLLSWMRPDLAIILIALLFTGLHSFNLNSGAVFSEILGQMVLAFCFSVWAGVVTYQSTFLIPLLAHVLLNLTATTDVVWVVLIVSVVVLADGILLIKIEKR